MLTDRGLPFMYWFEDKLNTFHVYLLRWLVMFDAPELG